MGTDIAAGNAMDAADTAMNVVVGAVTAGVTDMKQVTPCGSSRPSRFRLS